MSIFFGEKRLIRPLVFSFVPRCRLLKVLRNRVLHRSLVQLEHDRQIHHQYHAQQSKLYGLSQHFRQDITYFLFCLAQIPLDQCEPVCRGYECNQVSILGMDSIAFPIINPLSALDHRWSPRDVNPNGDQLHSTFLFTPAAFPTLCTKSRQPAVKHRPCCRPSSIHLQIVMRQSSSTDRASSFSRWLMSSKDQPSANDSLMILQVFSVRLFAF